MVHRHHACCRTCSGTHYFGGGCPLGPPPLKKWLSSLKIKPLLQPALSPQKGCFSIVGMAYHCGGRPSTHRGASHSPSSIRTFLKSRPCHRAEEQL
jgi:hypothetical protein